MNEQQPFYHLRPNKFIDRNIFVQNLTYIKKLLPIENYSYIGFGSFLFDDFKIMHTQLDITKLVSLECDPEVYKRANFNKPYNCIALENTTSTDYITNLSECDENMIFWLDYTDPREIGRQFADFCSMLLKMNVYDIIRVTFNANPSTLGEKVDQEGAQNIHQKRLEKLKERIDRYIPSNTVPDDVTFARYPLLLLRCLKKAAMSTLVENPPYQNRFLFPIFSTVYKDGQQMVTFTGIVLDNHEKERDIRSCMEKCEQANFEWDRPCMIQIPPLTQKEILNINNLLPSENAKQQIMDQFSFSFVGYDMIDSYLSFYKYYPNFSHVNL